MTTNPIITPEFIGELIALGGYPESTVSAIKTIMRRDLGWYPEATGARHPEYDSKLVPRAPQVSNRDRVAQAFTARYKGVWQYDGRWLENGEVDRVRKVFNLIAEISRELNHKNLRGMGSADFINSVRCHLQKSPEFEVRQCPPSV